jgi:hypothetical protein
MKNKRRKKYLVPLQRVKQLVAPGINNTRHILLAYPITYLYNCYCTVFSILFKDRAGALHVYQMLGITGFDSGKRSGLQ